MKVADIYVQLASNSVISSYTYKITDDIEVGNSVVIDINNQLKIGYVHDVYEKSEDSFKYRLKDVLSVVDYLSLNNYQKKIFKAIYDNSYTNFLNVYNLFFKDTFNVQIDIKYYEDENFLSCHSENNKKKNEEILKRKDIRKEVVIRNTKNPLQELYIKTRKSEFSIDTLTKRQLEVLDIINSEYAGKVRNKVLVDEVKVSSGVINKLIEKGFVYKETLEKKFNQEYLINTDTNTKLTDNQKQVIKEIEADNQINLLHGVTASGKTEIYVKLIKNLLEKNSNDQILIVAPQMALSLQLVSRMQNEFDNVIIYHDKLTSGEKASYHKQIKEDKCQIVIGMKESLLLPFENLKMVIVDEEHSSSYKSNKDVKYHIYDLLKTLKNENIKVVLASATPSIESYTKALKSIYKLVELKNKYNDFKHPDVKFIKNKKDDINDKLIEMIKVNKTANRPSLIYFHKTGYSKRVECNNCYSVQKCPNCDTTLTYHKQKNILKCQFCGLNVKFDSKCFKCGSKDLAFDNMGIEKFTEIIKGKFSELNVAMIDSSMKKEDILNILTKYNDSYYDIIIGSQIISQGLNFLNIANAYIVNIDELLFISEYNANERTYNLLNQIVGRVGRNLAYSEVYIETNHFDNFVMQAIKNNDYLSYYNEEIENRKMLKTPPYYNICRLELRHTNEMLLENILKGIKGYAKNEKLLTSNINTPFVSKIGNEYRKYILIKYKREDMKTFLNQFKNKIKENNIKIIVDLKMINNGK